MPGISLEMRGNHAIIRVMINPFDRPADLDPRPPARPDADAGPDPLRDRIQDLLAALDQATEANEQLRQENEL